MFNMSALIRFLCSVFLPVILFGCVQSTPSKSAEQKFSEPDTNLTLGVVRQNLFYSLRNVTGIDACYNSGQDIDFTLITAKATGFFLSELNIDDGSELGLYQKGVNSAPQDKVTAVDIIIPESEHRFLYIPNDGSYDIQRNAEEFSLLDTGILVDLSLFWGGRQATTKTCVTCSVESGKKGQGCTCTSTTKTVCCSTQGCSPTCGTGYQCPYSCNRAEGNCFEVCDNAGLFTDERPFYTLTPDDMFVPY